MKIHLLQKKIKSIQKPEVDIIQNQFRQVQKNINIIYNIIIQYIYKPVL